MQLRKTRKIHIGKLVIGGDSPIAVQSMAATQTQDLTATARQIEVLEKANADIIRIAVDNEKDVEALKILRKEYEKQREELSKIQTEIGSLSEERQICSNQMLVLSEQERGAKQTIERLNDERTDGERKKKSHYQRIEELEAEYAAVEPKVKTVTKEYESLINALERSDVKYSDAQKRLDSLSEAQIEHLKKLNNSRSLRERTEETVDEKIQALSRMEKRSADHDVDNKRFQSKQKSLIAERKSVKKLLIRIKWKWKSWNHQLPSLGLKNICLLYTSPSPRDGLLSRMPSSA